MGFVDIMVLLVVGLVIGLLGKFIAPGDRDNIPLWLTVLCGIGGAVIGTFAYSQFFDPNTPGLDIWRHLWEIVVAAVLVMIAATAAGRIRHRQGH